MFFCKKKNQSWSALEKIHEEENNATQSHVGPKCRVADALPMSVFSSWYTPFGNSAPCCLIHTLASTFTPSSSFPGTDMSILTCFTLQKAIPLPFQECLFHLVVCYQPFPTSLRNSLHHAPTLTSLMSLIILSLVLCNPAQTNRQVPPTPCYPDSCAYLPLLPHNNELFKDFAHFWWGPLMHVEEMFLA